MTLATRRAFLTTTAAVGTAALAGCSALADQPTPRYEVSTQPSIGETHVKFLDGVNQLGSMTVRVGSPIDGTARVETLLAHGLDRVVDYRVQFRPVTPTGSSCWVALRRPQPAPLAVRFGPGADHEWTEFAVTDFGNGGRGSFGVGFDVTPETQPTH